MCKMEIINDINTNNECNFVTEEDVKLIVKESGHTGTIIEDFFIYPASDKMLGFLAEYWKLKVNLSYNENRKQINLFIKAISRSNAAKAKLVKEIKVFDKEIHFYSNLKKIIQVTELKPYCAEFVTVLNDAMVLYDLNALQYQNRHKFDKFDTAHTLEALKTLARFHASSIIFEEKRSQKLGKTYNINEEYEEYLDKGGYHDKDMWYITCMKGALEVIKSVSKYSNDEESLKLIDKNLPIVWFKALQLSDASPKYRNVICHRDLWNNNILFHYKLDDKGDLHPDDCVLVDFQAIRYQPPAGDVVQMLCCNLDPKVRKENMNIYLKFYYNYLGEILSDNNLDIKSVTSLEDFIASADEQMLWGLTVTAALFPQIMLDDELMTKTFTNNEQFDQVLCKDKGPFVKEVMASNERYKVLILDIFEEYVERFCLKDLY